MRSAYHKGRHHRWTEGDLSLVRQLAEQGADAVARHFNVTVGSVVIFCKRNGIQLAGYRYRRTEVRA